MRPSETVVAATVNSDQRSLWRRVFSFPVLLGVMLTAAGCVATSWNGSVLGGKSFGEDTWSQIATGSYIWETGHWPTTDPFSETCAGAPWIPYEWLADLVMYFAARTEGLQGLAMLLLLTSAAFMLLLYIVGILTSRNAKAAAVSAGLMLPVAGPFFTLRPQLFGLTLALLTLLCLELFRRRHGGAIWVVPPIFVLWANTHATFVVGLSILAAYIIGGLAGFRSPRFAAHAWTSQQRRKLEITLLLSLAATVTTPYGARLAGYVALLPFQLPLSTANYNEWYPLPLMPRAASFLALVCMISFIVVFVRGPASPLRIEQVALLLFGGAEAFLHFRFIPLFVVFFAPVLAQLLAPRIRAYEPGEDHPALNATLVAAVVMGLTLLFPSRPALYDVVKKQYPVGAIPILRQQKVLGQVFNPLAWGGYLISSGQRPFIDGRADLYEPCGLLLDYLQVVNIGYDPEAIFRRHDIQVCLVRRGEPPEQHLAASRGWTRVYSDSLSEVFVRKGFAHGTPTPSPVDSQR